MGSSSSYFGIYILIAVIAFVGIKRRIKSKAKDKLKDAVQRYKQNQ